MPPRPHPCSSQKPAADLLRSLFASVDAETCGTSGPQARIDLTDEQCEALYAVAHRHYSLQDYPEARKLFALMAAASPADARGHMGLAACLQMEHEHERAARHYFMASLLDLTRPEPVIHSAECFLALGRSADADKALTLARSQVIACAEHHGLLPRIESLQAAMHAGDPR